MIHEQIIIGSILRDNSCVDAALQGGLTEKHFGTPELARTWIVSVKLRTSQTEIDLTSLHVAKCNLTMLMECEAKAPTTAHFQESLTSIIEKFMVRKVTEAAKELIVNAKLGRDEITKRVEEMVRSLDTVQQTHRNIRQIGDEVEAVATAQIEGRVDPRVKIEWPIAKANQVFTEIMPHELACIGARPKQGKSSLALQILGHNIQRGLKGAYFTLETADSSAFSLLAAQIARVNLQRLSYETREAQQRYIDTIRSLKNASNLQIFEKDMSMKAIESRCRLLKASFAPDFVIIDHLHQIQNEGRSSYEKLTDIALRMVELRKQLGCAVILCIQLNRASETNERAPKASDARDSGAIEAAAHRMVLLYRPQDDFDGIAQIGTSVEQRSVYHYYIMQELMRDGPSGCNIRARFNGPLSSFTD